MSVGDGGGRDDAPEKSRRRRIPKELKWSGVESGAMDDVLRERCAAAAHFGIVERREAATMVVGSLLIVRR